MRKRTFGPKTLPLLVGCAFATVSFRAGSALADWEVELPTCAALLNNNSLTIDRGIPAGEKWAYLRSRYEMQSQLSRSPETCAELNWVRLWGASNLKVTIDGEADVKPARAWDCAHSTLSWALYTKKTSGTWHYAGGGERAGDWVNDECVYTATDDDYWGRNAVTNQVPDASGEYRIGWTYWQHNDPGMHGGGYCADDWACYPPIDITLQNTLSPLRKDFAHWGGPNSEFTVLDWGVTRTRQWGVSGDWPIPVDFNGDKSSDWTVFRPSNGTWYIGYSNSTAGTSVQWGLPGDVPLRADTDGDARHDTTVWRPSNGYWYTIYSSTGTSTSHQWGLNGDAALSADYTADGRTDMMVWRPSNATFYLKNVATLVTSSKQFGLYGDKPVVGDFNGDRTSEYAVWRPSDGKWYIYDPKSGGTWIKQWGVNGDVPMAGDYDGDGRADPAFYRASEKRWYWWASKDNRGYYQAFGITNAAPVAMNLDL